MIDSTPLSPGRRKLLGAVGASLAAAITIGAGSMRNLVIRTTTTATVTERGASLEGLRQALREVGSGAGGIVRIAVPRLLIDTAQLVATGPLLLPAATVLEGNNAQLILGGDRVAPPLFVARDVSRVTIRNLAAQGNDRAIADAVSGSFALFEMSLTAASDMEDLRLENVRLSGFRAERWVQFLQRHAGRRMSGISITDFQAGGGSSLAPSAIGVSACALWLQGIAGDIRDVEIQRPVIQAAHLKTGVALMHKVRNARIGSAVVSDAGAVGAIDDAGAYAVMAYGDRGEISDITIVQPVLHRPRSAGIYLRGVDRVTVIDASISDQTDQVNTTLPKGGIAINGCTGVTISKGEFRNNVFDISVADGGLVALDIEIRSVVASGSNTSILFEVSPGGLPPSGVRVIDCALSAKRRVLRVLNEQQPGRYYNDVSITGGTFRSDTAATVLEFTQGEITAATGYRVEDVTVQANGIGIMASGLQGSLSIRRATIQGLGRLDCGIAADDCPGIVLDAVTFRDIQAGYAYSARSLKRAAGGWLQGLRFERVTHRMSSGSFAGTT